MFSNIAYLKITPKFLLFCLFFSLVALVGCLGGMQTTTTATQTETGEAATSKAETETSTALAELQISTPKTNYAVNEAIPLALNIQNGKFDLLVPFFSLATRGAFTQITVTDANGQTVTPKHPITQENPQKYVKGSDGKSTRCIQGFQLKASANQELALKDIQKYYQLQPGTYTVTLAIELEVYKESITEEHPEIRELRQDMARLEKDPNLQGAAKQDALSYYQEQIKFIQERQKDAVKDIYLPVKSLRGKASLVSNSITVTVEPETKAPTGRIQRKPSEINKSDTASPKKSPDLKDLVARRADEWVAPKYKTKVDAKYPKSAKEGKKGGEVTLQVTIDENGVPQDIVALTKLGFGLEEAAIEALKKSTFHPAMKGGKPISTQVKIPFSFAITHAN